jgi:Uma2 family endonuclease
MLMTPEEFDALPESAFDPRFRFELIHGVLVAVPPPGAGERSPNDELGYMLRLYRGTHPEGAAMDETLPEQTVVAGALRRRCDRAVWAGLGRLPDLTRDAPTIAIEFVSGKSVDRRRDYEEKRREYLGAGVREYWIIDRFRRMMTVYRAGADGPVALTVQEQDSYQTDLLPGFVLPLARLLAKADDWQPKTRPRRPPAEGAK